MLRVFTFSFFTCILLYLTHKYFFILFPLGESASVLVEKQRRLNGNEKDLNQSQQEEDIERKTEENLLNNKEFYQQMMVYKNSCLTFFHLITFDNLEVLNFWK